MSTEALLAEADTEGGLRQFVTFECGGEVFAVDLAPVQEIIRLPQVVRVPLAPASLEGLANLRGQVLPVLSLRRLFGFTDRDADDATRVVIIDAGQPLGFVVDRVSRVITADPANIEDAGTIQSTVDSDLLSGLLKDTGGHAMVMVVDFEKLVDREFSALLAAAEANQRAVASGSPSSGAGQHDQAVLDELPLVSFHVAGQEYAVGIEDVQEIVQVPETLVKVPKSDHHVLGLMSLRSRLLPLVSLRRLFGLDDRPLDDKSRIVVLEFGGLVVGLGVDGVNEVLRVARLSVEPMPALLARNAELAEIAGLCRLEGGQRLVSVILARQLFRLTAVQRALEETAEETARPTDAAEEETVAQEEEQVVVFRLDREEFGVPIDAVQEIVRVPEELVKVPKTPAAVEGVINLRGTVLPVVDLRVRLGLPRADRNDRQRIMVFLLGGQPTGFVVDQVAEVLKIPFSAIEPAPSLSAAQGTLLSRMANLQKQKRMVQLLDPSHLFEGDELAQVAAAAGMSRD